MGERERRSDLVRRAHWGELRVSEWSEWAAADAGHERGKFEKSRNNMFAPRHPDPGPGPPGPGVVTLSAVSVHKIIISCTVFSHFI